jgi:quinoprotein glucose dehydrogenase
MRKEYQWATRALAVTAGLMCVVSAGSSYRTVNAAEAKRQTSWIANEGGPDSAQYSNLTQINKKNVSQLKQAWFFPAGNNGFRYGSNPLVIDGVMYVIGAYNNLVAVDAATGKEIWAWDSGKANSSQTRGLSYWESKDRRDRRLFYATNNRMHAIDAKTGKLIDSFGDHGDIDLRENLGRDPKTIRQIESQTPGRIFENLLILGSATGEDYGSSPGDIRAYNVLTGKMVWSFHTIPHPGEMGYDTWPKDAWKYIGGVNDWGGMTIDVKRGIAYIPLGSPTYDFYGADRPGANLFSDCLLALDARTGKYLWHFQEVHHDLWDYDYTTSPKLLTIKHDGKMVDVVAQAGKTGFLYVFDRVTGKPIWPIEERPVPKSPMPGEEAWPTQPFPTVLPPFAQQKYTADDVNPYIQSADERAKIRDIISKARNGLFVPPSTENTIEPVGNSGGANWGSAATDPTTGTVYILSKNAPTMLTLRTKPPTFDIPGSPATKGQAVYIQNCLVCHTSTLTGQPPSIPSLVGVVERTGEEHVRATVQNGAAPMPAFTDLSYLEMDNLIAYLKAPDTARIPPGILSRLMAPPKPVAPVDDGTPVRYYTGYGYMNSSENLPSVKPPWSTITAYDLNQGTMKWQIPAGTVASLVKRGITAPTGSFWPRGGPIVTAGGLVFLGTLSDGKLWAFDKDTGKTLWSAQLPADPDGIPAVYEVAGREYVVMSARKHAAAVGDVEPASTGAKGDSSTEPETQGYYVFALPKK